MKPKPELRDEMRSLRKAIDSSHREETSSEICRKILKREDVLWALAEHKPFAVYLASKDEIDLTELIENLWDADVTVAVPSWDSEKKTYMLSTYSNTTPLIKGAHGIDEPAEINLIDPQDIAVWIVPGLAFTSKGERLGYGGGWYDKYLAVAPEDAISIGVGYNFQLIDELPMESHDKLLTAVITAE